jgi:hypothetical protein
MKIYYTVELGVMDTDYLSGSKDVYAYQIQDNVPKLFFEIGIENSLNAEAEMQTWLDNNGYENTEYDMERI